MTTEASSLRTNGGGNVALAIVLAMTAFSFFVLGRTTISTAKCGVPPSSDTCENGKDNKSDKKRRRRISRGTKDASKNEEETAAHSEMICAQPFSPRRTLEHELLVSGESFVHMEPIGVVQSIYRLCVGTPRQGLLAPHSRGRIRLHAHVSLDALDGLQEYSHVWILFLFHLNTKSDSKKNKTPSKIAPPALGGRKVGVFASRSPHRFNPIGISLVKLDRVTTDGILHISGLDLVDGTPVLDIKPYVPHYDAPLPTSGSTTVSVPAWVSTGLTTRRSVDFTTAALRQLRTIVETDRAALEFYVEKEIGGQDVLLDEVIACIEEVLSIDVRSRFQTKKARKGEFRAQLSNRLSAEPIVMPKDEDGLPSNSTGPSARSADEQCTQQLDNLLISYIIQAASTTNFESSNSSGAEDHVQVTSIARLGAKLTI